jgi:hypothetical protein
MLLSLKKKLKKPFLVVMLRGPLGLMGCLSSFIKNFGRLLRRMW